MQHEVEHFRTRRRGVALVRLLLRILQALLLILGGAYLVRWVFVRLRPIRLTLTEETTPPISPVEVTPGLRRIVVSDLHFGGGDKLDDFEADEDFESFVTSYVLNGTPTELILAGDTLEFLQVCLTDVADDDWSAHAAVCRLEAIVAAHPRVFAALAAFVAQPTNQLTILIGNHDFELHYRAAKQRLCAVLGVAADDARVRFGIEYTGGGIYLVHGNQFDAWNRFVNFAGISEPFEEVRGTQIVKEIINDLEEDSLEIAPLLDNVKPTSAFFWYALALPRLRRPAARRFVARALLRFIQIAVWPTPHHMPITGRGPGGLLSAPPFALIWSALAAFRRLRVARQRQVARQVSEVASMVAPPEPVLDQVQHEASRQLQREVRQFNDKVAREMTRLAQLPEYAGNSLFVCGHTHQAGVMDLGADRYYINTGTWTEIIYDIATMRRQEQRCPFLEITYPDGDRPSAQLLVWRGLDEPPQPWQDGPGVVRKRQKSGGARPATELRHPQNKEVVS